jgi:phage terminase large subunit-like protein
MPKDKDSISGGGDEHDYKVGYKRPPRHTQFQPGRSGNPAGRPKGLNNLATDVKHMLEVPVIVTEGGRKRRVSTQRGALMLLREMGLRGNRHAQKLLIDLAKLFNNESDQTVVSELGPDDQEILDDFRAKVSQHPTDPRPPADHRPADDHRSDVADDPRRLNDKEKGPIVVVMQRLHESDLAGHLLEQRGWEQLILPAIAMDDSVIPICPDREIARRIGDVLHPQRESKDALDRIKVEIGSLQFSAQYQQQPVPAEGNLIKRDWLKWYEIAPPGGGGAEVVQSWDIATTIGESRDWSVCTTWLIIKRNYYLLDVWRGRVEFPQLKRKLADLARQHRPNRLLIEKAGPGLALIQELRANPVLGLALPIGIKPECDKLTWQPNPLVSRPAKSTC